LHIYGDDKAIFLPIDVLAKLWCKAWFIKQNLNLDLNLAVTLKKYGVHKRNISSLKSMTAKGQSCHLRSFNILGLLSKILSDILDSHIPSVVILEYTNTKIEIGKTKYY